MISSAVLPIYFLYVASMPPGAKKLDCSNGSFGSM